jgi:formylglycine-generating enzyme required for sulfatase activity
MALALAAALALGWQARQRAPAQPAPQASSACALPAQDPGAAHAGMVWVPAGAYTPGDTVYPEERPAGRVRVEGFWMDRTEVTNAQFARFVQASGYVTVAERPVDAARHGPGMPAELLRPGALVFSPPDRLSAGMDANAWWRYVPGAHWRQPGGPGTDLQGRDDHPVVALTVDDARAYAAWLGRELPSEAQWEWAARAARDEAMPLKEQPRQANTWQGPFPVNNSRADGFASLAPVGCYAPNALGLYDMVGNVWELTADAYGLHGQEGGPPISVRAGPARQVVIKGGSFLCSPDYCMRYRPGARQPQDEDLGASHVGFRTVLRAAPPAAGAAPGNQP